jgi:nucleoid-associated protein YgaU
MKKITLFALIVSLMLPVLLSAEFRYLSDDEIKQLKGQERKQYFADMVQAVADLQQRKADALANKERYQGEIDQLNGQLKQAQDEYAQVKAEIYSFLGVTEADLAGVLRKIEYFNNQLAGYEKMTDDQLWNAKKAVTEMVEEYNTYRHSKYARMPEVRTQFDDLDRRVAALERNLQNARPKYYEDEYTVVKGDNLSKISGYSFIYNDPTKWGIIYRANRDQISDPNIVRPDQVLRIPRGLPDSWKVWRGECLWRIASYPEVYGKGSEWPKIYRANQDQIKDPNLIYPNQVFTIPRD